MILGIQNQMVESDRSSLNAEPLHNNKNSVQNLPLIPSSVILGRIVEKKYAEGKNSSDFTHASLWDDKQRGFPDVFCVDQKASGAAGSLFLQQVSKNLQPQTSLTCHEGNTITAIPRKNMTVMNPLKSEIHEENLEKLKAMTAKEILQAKSQLESTLSPELIKFLRSKNKILNKSTTETNKEIRHEKMEINETVWTESLETPLKSDNNETKIEMNSTKMDYNFEKLGNDTPAIELAGAAAAEGWMHMDTIEREKLEWMKDVPDGNDKTTPEEPYNARFDFNGVLLPFHDENLTVDKGLHHHGEEPDRPGYSLQELLQLSRSSNQQQRCTALTTLANIMEKSRNGWYDKVLEPAPLIALNEKNILLLLRFSLDDTSVAIVTASMQALRAFLYSEADEICLDRLFGWRYSDGNILEPELTAPKTDVTDTSALKDHELAQLDTIVAAIRSDIVIRLRYVLNEMHPPPIGVTAALEILTRLSRQSRTTALNIACIPNLLESIVQNFIPVGLNRFSPEDPTKNAYGFPSIAAVRFCRILITYAGRPVAERLDKLKIVHRIVSYAFDESISRFVGIRLAIESLRLWKLLLALNVAVDSIAGARLQLLSQLRLLLDNHDLGSSSELMCEHAAAVINVSIHESSLISTIRELLNKWTTQLAKVSAPTWSQTKLVAIILANLKDPSFSCQLLSNSNMFDSLCSTSNLLSGYVLSSSRDPPSLPSLGVLAENGQVQPAVSMNSILPFLGTWIKVLGDTKNESRFEELKTLLNNKNLAKYIERLSREDWSLEISWYTRIELFLVTGIVRSVMRFQNIVGESTRRMVLKIGIKLVSTLPSDASLAVKEILACVLNDETLTIEKLTNNLNSLKLTVDNEKIHKLVNLPPDLSIIYGEYVSSSGCWEQAAMPRDWLYLPLVAVYSSKKNHANDWKNIDTTKIIVLLSLELSMPEIVENLSPSLRFSRLLLIYLCDTIYLDDNIAILLNETLRQLLKKYYKEFNFNTALPGLSSFTDLFTSLCESFCANSYGNDGFSMALIIPLGQRHDVHYRKLLWSEHAAALRYIRLKGDNLAVPLTEFLYPVEQDATLIESYMTALVRGTVKSTWCPLMYEIAMHHSAMYIRGNTRLATVIRKKISELKDKELAYSLLNYEPPKNM
ncbi:RNA polymerase II-associated protein 1 isoform X2 [Venturia canescens]|uniref:RNA polymerase II-associated protein 1 isoform X2 n=1 Tax=Venturia canescens TaxID=32260 RepID=UPI001C9C7298|nr:RNA polymerase II-associated protein 1 isoform X2 [Venturia canescens]